jgi:hypothetical protein
MGCTPSGSFPTPMPIVIPAVPLKANGAFSAAVSVPGVFDNAKASFKYSFAGRFAAATSSGPPTAAGTLREDIVFHANGVTEECTSKLRSWTATHDPQPAPTKAAAVPGSYTARGSAYVYGSFSFFVAPGGTKLLNVSVPVAGSSMGCTPSGSFPAPMPIVIPAVPIKANGAFSAAVSVPGVFDNAKASFKYSFAGYFEGATPAGPLTVAGTLREDISFPANGVTEECTSGLRPWTATHDPQPAPTKTAAVPGSYTARGSAYVYGSFSFSVAPGGTKLLNVSVPVAGSSMGCTPGGSFPAPSSIVIPQVAVRPDGSFAVAVSSQAPYDNTTAKFTYSFAGNFEGATPAGAETVTGSLREDIAFTANGAAETCTSNVRPWTAVRSS